VRASGHGLDWSNKPEPFKIYPDLPVTPLPRDFPVPTMDALAAISGEVDAAAPLDLERLAALLFFSAGVTRRQTYPGGGVMYFRAAPSTGALFQTEVYVVAGDVTGLAAGVYHFSPGDFALRQLRAGDFRGALAIAAADEDLASRPAVIALTAIYWRNTWKYQARGYRHLFWDSGTMLANLLAAATALALPARGVTGFVDIEVNGLLAVDPEKEGTLFLAPVGAPAMPAPSPPVVATITPSAIPLSDAEVDYPLLRDAYANSALDSEADAVLGLEAGADDYVTKPFGLAELRSRIRAVLRRTGTRAMGDEVLVVGPVALDRAQREVKMSGEAVRLTFSEFELLDALMADPGRLLNRQELLRAIWGDSAYRDPRAIDVHIRHLREKLEPEPEKPRYILTVRGAGYRLRAP